MKKLLKGVGAVALVACLASVAYATPQLTLGYGSVHSGSGGEFAVTSSDSWAGTVAGNYGVNAQFNGGFETFCIEYNEHFSPNSPYYYQISPNAIKGGNTVNDPVSVGTAYLYSLFAQGALPGYTYSSTTSAGNLQNTIWYLEGERYSLPGGALIANPGTFDSLLIAEFGNSSAVWMASSANSLSHGGALVNANFYGVAALNLAYNANGDNGLWTAQDQLIYKSGGFSTPDGGMTLMLLGMALGGLTLLRRKLA